MWRSWTWLLVVGVGCARSTPPEVVGEPVPISVDLAGLSGGVRSASTYNARVMGDGVLDRLELGEDMLQADEDGAVQPWARSLVLSHLQDAGVVLFGPSAEVLDSSCTDTVRRAHARYARQTGLAPLAEGCSSKVPEVEGAATSVIRDVVFQARLREVSVGIRPVYGPAGKDHFLAYVRSDLTQPSVCGPDYSLPLGHVALRATLQRASDGALGALIHEETLTDGLAVAGLTGELPPPSTSPMAFCRAFRELYVRSQAVLPSHAAWTGAGERVLHIGLGPAFRARSSGLTIVAADL